MSGSGRGCGICSVEGCAGRADAKGMCPMHYSRWKRHGDPLAGGVIKGSQPVCSIAGCGKRTVARGWCSSHLQRWRRHGDPLSGGITPGERLRYLREVVLPYNLDECLLWPHGRISGGYAQVVVDGQYIYAHRLACEHRNGPPPSASHEAAHLCGNGHLGCVNPRHLEWKTREGNQADRAGHGTAPRGEMHGGARLTAENVRRIRALGGKTSHRKIAAEFGVSTSTVSNILAGKTWRWPNYPHAEAEAVQ